ncbi:MAG TPA: hypothetical protein GXX46_03880 [Peptococcaceae bacterium]|nr:hypothetical protein [Peptococcaceae bacterium]
MSKDKFLTLALLAVLFLNFFLVTQINELKNRLENLNYNYQNLQSSFHSLTEDVNHSLERFTREQSWITPVQINEDKSRVDSEKALVVLNWQIKDFIEGSEIVLHYRNTDSEEFRTIAAESSNTGFFEASLPLEMKAEPSWEINVSISGKKRQAEGAAEIIPEKTVERISTKERDAEQALQCYVSMKTKGQVKSSELSYLNYSYLAHKNYESVHGHVRIDGSKHYIQLTGMGIGSNAIKSIYAEFYSGQKLIDKKEIPAQDVQIKSNMPKPEGGEINHYSLEYDSGSEKITGIILEVTYSSGDSFSKEIV